VLAEAEHEQSRARPEDRPQARLVPVPVRVVEGVEEPAVDRGVEAPPELVEFEGASDAELDRHPARGGRRPRPLDRGRREVDAAHRVPARRKVASVLSRPTPDVEHATDDLARRLEADELRLGPARLPERRALVGLVEEVHRSKRTRPGVKRFACAPPLAELA
jgi:hypothetical protein